jgi:vacuolar-type H+-ATPase subunit E/Vma4
MYSPRSLGHDGERSGDGVGGDFREGGSPAPDTRAGIRGTTQEQAVHFLTKVFVVIATVLSIALSALTIAYATNTDRIRRDYEQQRGKLGMVEASHATSAAQHGSAVTRLNETIASMQNELSQTKGQLTDLQGQRSTLIAERDKANAERSTTQAKIDELAEVAKTQATLLTNYREEVEKLRNSELAFRQQRLDLEDRISDLESQREVLDQNYRALQEELAAIKTEAQGGRVAAGAVSGSSGAFTYAGPIIQGRVESVERDAATSKLMAKLNVGTNDKVAKNMRLYVIRDNNFVGNLVVTNADLSFSVGAFDSLGLANEVKAGDLIVSRVQ